MCSSSQEGRAHLFGQGKGVLEMVDSSRFWGGTLCVVIVMAAMVFLWGIAAQSYWALAIPVMAGFLGILAMGFWIGWTILTIKTAPPVTEPLPPSSAGGEESPAFSAPPAEEKKSV
jgi:hypothetical protein